MVTLARVQILVSTSSYGSSTLVRISITRIVDLTNSIMHSYGYCYAYYKCTLVVCIHDVCICMRMNTVYILCIRARRTRVSMHSGCIYIFIILFSIHAGVQSSIVSLSRACVCILFTHHRVTTSHIDTSTRATENQHEAPYYYRRRFQ